MRRRPVLRITLAYVVFGGVWILVSDAFVEMLFAGETTLLLAQTVKGLLYVGVTAALVYWLAARAWKQAQEDVAAVQRAEARARRSETLYRAVVDACPLAVFRLDPEGRVQLWNHAAARMLGWSAEEVEGELLPIVPEDRREEFAELREQVLAGKSISARTIRRRRKDGSPIELSLHAAPVCDDAGEVTGIMAVLDDVGERKRTGAALAESERQMATLVANLPGMVYRCRVDGDWTMLFVSEGARELTGHPPEDLEDSAGVAFADLVHPEDREPACAAIAEAVDEGRPFELEYRIVDADGTDKWVWERGRAVERDGETVLEGFMMDVTERKRAEERVRRSRRMLAQAERVARLGSWEWEVTSDRVFWSEEVYRILGLDPGEDALGFTDHDRLFEPEDMARLREAVDRAVEEGAPYELELRARRPDGERRHCLARGRAETDADGRVVRLFGSFQDITRRKRREEERERLLTAIDQAAEAIMITDFDGRIQFVNPAFERITGFSVEEALGETPQILKSGEHDEDFYRELWETIASGETWQGRIVNARKDGSLYTEEMVVSPVHDESGRIVSFVAVKRDVTRELELEEQLHQSRRLEAVGRLAGGVAHDFNNMLTVIAGHADIGLESTDPADELHGEFRAIRAAAERSTELTRQLLAFARKQIVDPKVLDLNGVIDDRLRMLQRLIGEDVTLSWKPGIEVWPVEIDPAQLDQVLTNLLANARDAIEDVGRVTIETGTAVVDEEYCKEHVDFEPGEYSLLVVSDTGRGMDHETRTRIFEPFFTTKYREEGTGLGLATVHGIVRQSDGFINVYSEPGEGTTFRVYLPRARSADVGEVATAEPAERETGTETVLLVEDEAALLDLAQRQLERLGYRVVPASGPEEALELAAAGPDIDLLITDVVMPGMNGRDLYRELLGSRPELRCLYISGYTANVILERGVLESDVHFLQKPFAIDELAVAVREALE